MTMSTEIETLRARKEKLKEELQIEGQKEKSLQEDIEILKEKVEIRGFEKELDTKRESVKQLESRKSELQGEWNQFAQDTRKDEESKEPSSEPTIIVMPAQTPESVESQESDAQKKRRWFQEKDISVPEQQREARAKRRRLMASVQSRPNACAVMSAFFQVKTVPKCAAVTGFSDFRNKHDAAMTDHF